jgi:hypothetical protein
MGVAEKPCSYIYYGRVREKGREGGGSRRKIEKGRQRCQNCGYQPGEPMHHAINLAGAAAEVTESSVSHSAPLDGSDWKRQPVPFGDGNVEICAMEPSYSAPNTIPFYKNPHSHASGVHSCVYVSNRTILALSNMRSDKAASVRKSTRTCTV